MRGNHQRKGSVTSTECFKEIQGNLDQEMKWKRDGGAGLRREYGEGQLTPKSL